MFVTARQLRDLHKSDGQITLPRAARLTPLAEDWIRQNRIAIAYDTTETPVTASVKPRPLVALRETPAPPHLPILWWCDGPCGPAKAAVVSLQANLQQISYPEDPAQLIMVIKQIASQMASGNVAGAILIVQSAAQAMLYLNRCPPIRAVLGTCREAVEQGLQLVAANVLVIEHPYKTLQQVRNMLRQFTKSLSEPSEVLLRLLKELSTCA